MSSESKRRAFTTDDLMHRQELGPPKRQKRIRDEYEDSSGSSDGSASKEDPESEGLSASDEDEEDQNSASEIPARNGGEEDTIPSRFSLRPRQGTITGKTTSPTRVHSPAQTFVGMGVSSSLVSAMAKMSIHTPTEVQAACIPPLLDGMYFSYSFFRP